MDKDYSDANTTVKEVVDLHKSSSSLSVAGETSNHSIEKDM